MSIHYEHGCKVLTFDHNEWLNNNPTEEEDSNRKKKNEKHFQKLKQLFLKC